MLLPQKNAYVSGEVSVFDTLVREGEARSSVALPNQLHAFLVGCLLEYLCDTDLIREVLAVTFLQAASKSGAQGKRLLKRSGDEALLLAGLFPERALRLNVGPMYFCGMGRAAYASLAAILCATGKREPGAFYNNVADNFRTLAKVLNGTRPETLTLWELIQRLRATP